MILTANLGTLEKLFVEESDGKGHLKWKPTTKGKNAEEGHVLFCLVEIAGMDEQKGMAGIHSC